MRDRHSLVLRSGRSISGIAIVCARGDDKIRPTPTSHHARQPDPPTPVMISNGRSSVGCGRTVKPCVGRWSPCRRCRMATGSGRVLASFAGRFCRGHERDIDQQSSSALTARNPRKGLLDAMGSPGLTDRSSTLPATAPPPSTAGHGSGSPHSLRLGLRARPGAHAGPVKICVVGCLG